MSNEDTKVISEGQNPREGVHSVRNAIKVRDLPPGIIHERHPSHNWQIDATKTEDHEYKTNLLNYPSGEYLRGFTFDPANLATGDTIYLFVGTGKQYLLWDEDYLLTTSIPIEVYFEIPEPLFNYDDTTRTMTSRPLTMRVKNSGASDNYVTFRYILWSRDRATYEA